MKNFLTLALFACAFSPFISAQETEIFTKNTTTFGFKGGLNQNYISTRYDNGYEGLSAYAGLFAETRLTEKWSVQNELLYSFLEGFNFVEVPVFAKYNMNSSWSVFAGPKLDFLVDAPVSGEELNPLGVTAEIGAQYNFGKRFFLEARYSYGFTKQININNFIEGDRRTLRLGAGIKF